jgi:hypothetical protein
MRRVFSKTQSFAERLAVRLIACETTAGKSDASTPPSAFLVCEKLRPLLATLLGSVGFSALLSRALALASSEVAWLRALRVGPSGALEGLAAPQAHVSPDETVRGAVALVAQLLGLLATFIGEDLTLRFVREVWPKLAIDNLDSAKGSKNEEQE